MGGVSEIVGQSNEILKATMDGDADKVAEMIEIAHDKEIPFLQYNNENSMSCVITLCYLSAGMITKSQEKINQGKDM